MIPKIRGKFGDIRLYPKEYLKGILWSGNAGKKKLPPVLAGKKLVIALIIASMLIASSAIGFAMHLQSQTNTLLLNDDGRVVEITTMEKTVGDLLEKYNINLKEGDELEPAKDTLLKDCSEIKIKRAMTAYVFADNQQKTVYAVGGTVGDALRKAGITVDEDDEVTPGMNEQLTPGTYIQVTRVKKEIIVEKEAIPYKVVSKKDSDMKSGTEKVTQKGKQGELEKQIEIVYKDGKEISRKVISETVTQEPVDKVVVKGTKEVKVASRGSTSRGSSSRSGSESSGSKSSGSKSSSSGSSGSGGTATVDGKQIKYIKVMVMEATAYTHTGRKTATGIWPHRGIIAVDPRVIPYGTKVYVEDYGYAIAADCGGGVKGNKIDLFMETREECIKWGRRNKKMYIIEWGK